ncbi:MAG: regulatory protein RecX [Gammaproteobacteria bacterium]|nr:regulatory protein RecX [Gammaproteobacteria bacterium]
MRRPRKPDSEPAEADERAVRTAALALLAGRDFGRVELARRLERRGYPETVVEAVIAGLVAERLLSESRFIEQFIRMHAGRGHGPLRIRAELRERRIADAEIDAGLDAAGEDWTAIARETRRKRFGAAGPADYRERARQGKFLQYRGFTSEQIRAALGPGDDIDP